MSEILAAIDIGTSKICCIVAEANNDGTLNIIGIGETPSFGIRKGEIVNLKEATDAVHDAIENAENNSNYRLSVVAVSVSGIHIQSFSNRGSLVTDPDTNTASIITPDHVAEVAIKAKEVALPSGNTFLHSIIQRYYIDNQTGVLAPEGLLAHQLIADFHIIHGTKTRIQNTLQCVENSEMNIENVVAAPLASATALLDENHLNLGVIIIDIGGGVTDWITYADGAISQSGVLGIGGDHIDNDIAIGLNLPLLRAKKLKETEGSTLLDVPPDEIIAIKNESGSAGKNINRSQLNNIIRCRIRETFEIIKNKITTPLSSHGSGIILTGGTSLLPGIRQTAEAVFGLPVQPVSEMSIAGPKTAIINPKYATAIGTLKHCQQLLANEPPPSLWRKFLDTFRF